MEQILIEVAKQVPSLGVLGVIVFLFIKHLEKSSDSWRDTVRDLQKENMEARAQSRETIRENTSVAKENTVAMTKLTDAVEHLARKT